MLRGLSRSILFALVTALPACSRGGTSSAPEPSEDPPALSAEVASTPWCGEGFRAVGDDVCLALPGRFADPPSLVIFAHGMIAPNALPTEEQATLLAATRAHGLE